MLIKGLVLGFSIAAPVGPIGLLCLRRGLEKGFWAAFSSGLGAATADACYGLLGAFGLAAVCAILLGHALWLRLFGGLFLFWLAWQTWRSVPARQAAKAEGGGLWRGYSSDRRCGGACWRGWQRRLRAAWAAADCAGSIACQRWCSLPSARTRSPACCIYPHDDRARCAGHQSSPRASSAA